MSQPAVTITVTVKMCDNSRIRTFFPYLIIASKPASTHTYDKTRQVLRKYHNNVTPEGVKIQKREMCLKDLSQYTGTLNGFHFL